MIIPTLTPAILAALTLPDGKNDDFAWLGDLQRAAVRLRRNKHGKVAKTYVAQYRRGSRSPKKKLGSPATLTIPAFYKAARKFLAQVDVGGDPVAEHKAKLAEEKARLAKEKFTGRYVAELYLAYQEVRVEKEKLRRTSLNETRFRLMQGWSPLLERPISDIERKDVRRRLDVLEEIGTATACNAYAALRAMMIWAVERDYVARNPMIGVTRPKLQPRERVPNDDEIVSIWCACGDDDHGKIAKLGILGGQRRGEIAAMKWSELDLDPKKQIHTLPASRSKSRREHVTPLSGEMLAILATSRK
jgi:hypothetical protein